MSTSIAPAEPREILADFCRDLIFQIGLFERPLAGGAGDVLIQIPVVSSDRPWLLEARSKSVPLRAIPTHRKYVLALTGDGDQLLDLDRAPLACGTGSASQLSSPCRGFTRRPVLMTDWSNRCKAAQIETNLCCLSDFAQGASIDNRYIKLPWHSCASFRDHVDQFLRSDASHLAVGNVYGCQLRL